MAERKYKRYTNEFKREAVRLAETSDKPKTQVARELGIRVNQLLKWKRELDTKQDDAFPGKGRQSGYAGELSKLRREIERLRLENEILKKAAVGSTGQCNTICFNVDLEGGVYGTNGAARAVCFPEGGAVAKVEKRTVFE